MPDAKCRKCGSMTNTAVANVDWTGSDEEDGWTAFPADGCYLRWDTKAGRYVKGCIYEDLPLDSLERRFADKILDGYDIYIDGHSVSSREVVRIAREQDTSRKEMLMIELDWDKIWEEFNI